MRHLATRPVPAHPRPVSILIPFEKEMRRPRPRGQSPPPGGFNPHPLREGDASSVAVNHRSRLCDVSILIPFEKEMRRRDGSPAARSARRFNPHPLREGDASVCPNGDVIYSDQFQSSSPSRRRCVILMQWAAHRPGKVSILIPFEKEMRPSAASCTPPDISLFQSSSPSRRRCVGNRRPLQHRGYFGFNPHPLREGDASWRGSRR